MPGPAYRILTPRLVLRCWNPADAPLLREAVTESLEHLREWMPWARYEPESLDHVVERLRRMRAQFDSGEDFVYGIFDPSEARVLGGTGLHTRVGPDAREIGYWIHKDQMGQGLATEAAGALTRVALEVDGVERVEIHCDPQNTRSAAVPRKLGYTLDASLRRRARTPDGEPRDTMVWSIFRDELAASAAAGVQTEAYDVMGRRII